jgi:hypothetical protein
MRMLLCDERLDRLPERLFVVRHQLHRRRRCFRRLPFCDLTRGNSGDAALIVLVRPAAPSRVFSDMVRRGGWAWARTVFTYTASLSSNTTSSGGASSP